MALHLLIDGYNLLHQIPELVLLMQEDPEEARKALLKQLQEYQRIRRHKITVVFDAWGRNEPQSKVNIKGIQVIFTAHGETADDYIKRRAAKEKERAVVITSDRAIRSYVETYGAISVTSRDFLSRMEAAFYEEMKGEKLAFEPRPRKRLPKKARQRLAKIAKL
ncbi:NYN domain-containing protein [Thermodesulfatator atlanticus]|uniref:NYN domain-containing protein n=1 Tax=Thermodesulfatator atlanticus TaxID=501497 RepID=UPI0003B5E61A|nr:NYN domain-containing protein [Thermodesulfatator atlanticus]